MACFLLGLIAGGGGVVALTWAAAYLSGINKTGLAYLLNGAAQALIRARQKLPPPPPEPPPAAVPVRLLPQVAADAPARPNLLTEPRGANSRHGRAARTAGGPKRQTGAAEAAPLPEPGVR